MATAELPRPGVEVIQEFRAASPTILRPTLVPFVCGPAKEIVEVTNADGTLNSQAKLGTAYEQLPRVISQTSFPSPRNNIAEVDVEEASIKTFFQFGGSLRQLERDPGESFLTSFNYATRAAIRSNYFVTGTGLALNGKILVLAIDVTARLNTTKDVTVTFSSSGGNLTPTQIVDQINDAVGDDVASQIVIGSNSRIQIASNKYGAASSVTVRPGGSANTVLGFADAAVEYRIEASGFRAQDQSNNTTLSPWVEWTKGSYQTDGTHQNSLPTYDDTIPTAAVGFGFLDSAGTFSAAYVQGSVTFTSGGLDLKVGDEFVADGAQPNSSAVIMKVEAARFKLGVVNTKLSVFDDDGDLVSAVYDASNVSTLFAGTPFAPRYAWFMAKNLTGNAAATAAALTGATEGTAATPATITAGSTPTGGGPYALAGLTLIFDVTVDGEVLDTQTFTFTGGPFADLNAIIAAIGTNVDGIFAHVDTVSGTKVAFSTDLTGATQAITLKGTSTALSALGFTPAVDVSDTGSDVTFADVPAVLLGGTQTFAFSATNGETLIVQVSTDGGSTWPTTRTYTFTTGTLSFANIGALVTELNTATRWAGAVLPTEFAFTASGDKVKITSTGTGSLIGLRIGSSSTAIGATAGTDLLFTSLQSDIGEENLSGQTLKFKLNSRPHTYSVLFTSDSLVDAVDTINEAVGWPVASIGGSADKQLVLTSTLKGYASKVEVIDDGTSAKANASLGFGSGNRTASGTGRPNPDFSVDVSGNVVLGAEILRSQLTGDPFDPGDADIYVQYTGLRKDVSPLAADPGMLRISDVTTLNTVLSPINSDNPLGLGMFFMLLNAPGLECAGLGVDAATTAAPEGTLEAYTRVANFLESEEVYAIAPLTHDVLVHQMFKTHVEFMSGPEQKGERILFVNALAPVRAVDDVVASGLSAESTATQNQLVLDVNPTPGLTDRGLDPLNLTYDDQVFIEITISGTLRRYLVSSVNGTLAVVDPVFAADENEDDFFSVTTLSEEVVNADWSMKVRGDKLLIAGSTLPDKEAIADTVAAQSNAYLTRRMYNVFPDKVLASISGTEEVLPGYYACAGIVGAVARFPPQQGFTNLPMTGYTGVQGSNDTYSTKQLNKMAGGGTYILVQEGEGAAVTCRHQLSTDVTSIERRELSITKVVDYVAKFLRTALRNFIGTFNITQPFLDTLSTVIQAMLGFLVENGIILGGDLNNLIQSKDSPDTVLVDVTLDVPYPCNYIRLTLVI